MNKPKDAAGEPVEVQKIDVDDSHVVEAPPADPEWQPAAVRWYESLKLSGQARFYEPSDWSLAWFLAESMSRDLGEQFLGFEGVGPGETRAHYGRIPLKGASLAAYLKGMSALLATEGDRRRAALELQRASKGPDADEQHAEGTVTSLFTVLAGG